MADKDSFIVSKLLEKSENDDSCPLAFCNLTQLRTRYQLWMENLPDIKPFYAVKSNNDPNVLKGLASLGTGFDCASLAELKAILELGVPPDDIVFANTFKFESHLRFAAKHNVSLLTFDSESELIKIKALYPTARLLVRIRADGRSALYPLGSKFGCSIPDSFKLLQLARDLDVKVVGVSFHVGCYCQTADGHCTAIAMASEVFQHAKGLGFCFTHLDIGGGFLGRTEEDHIFIESASEIKESVKRYFRDYPNLSVIAEPGTFMSTSCTTIATRIIGKRPSNDSKTMMYYINDSFFANLNVLPYVKSTVTTFPLKINSESRQSFIWGITCDEFDRLRSFDLPNMEVGDWLLFEQQGSYSTCLKWKYNGLEGTETFYLHEKGEISSKLDKLTLEDKSNTIDVTGNGDIAHEVSSNSVREFIHERLTTRTLIGFCDVSKIETRWQLWKKFLPNVKPFYAVKSNNDPVILKRLASLGAGFYCGSRIEMESVLNLGVSSSDIIYNNPCKPKAHLRYALEKTIPLLSFDSESELHKIAFLYPNAKLLICISSNQFVTPVLKKQRFPESKRGCSITESLNLLQIARDLGMNVVGVSFHVSNHHQSEDIYSSLIHDSHKVFEHGKSVGFHFTHLNIGGGFSGYEHDNENFIELSKAINRSIEECFNDYPSLTVIAEPGRFFASSCMSIATYIIGKKVVNDGDTSYYITDGVYGNFYGVLYSNLALKPFSLLKTTPAAVPLEEAPPSQCTVWGPTCDSLDKVGVFELPTCLDIGDYLVFPDMGAYSFAFSCNFNGLGGNLCVIYYNEK